MEEKKRTSTLVPEAKQVPKLKTTKAKSVTNPEVNSEAKLETYLETKPEANPEGKPKTDIVRENDAPVSNEFLIVKQPSEVHVGLRRTTNFAVYINCVTESSA